VKRHHAYAAVTIAVALTLDAVLGILFAGAEHIPAWHGLYCGITNAVTVGCDIGPRTAAGYVINAVECLTVVPLFAATFSLFTSGLAAYETHRARDEIISRGINQPPVRLHWAIPGQPVARRG
jgi:hypothetical protein